MVFGARNAAKLVLILTGLIIAAVVIFLIYTMSNQRQYSNVTTTPVQTSSPSPINFVPDNSAASQPSFYRPHQYQIWVTVFGGSTAGKIIKSAYVPEPNYKQLNPAN